MKKFISMALALVMTLSLCAVVSSTKAEAKFTDTGDLSRYAQQAADVIQKIEVMDGYDDGSFRPTAGLTRQAAAKIICNMILGPTTAKALPTNANPFPDVLAGNQFSGYISYCSQQGIISGYADGTFRPGDPLSGYAYLKMLLGALGYSAQQEHFVGDNWKVNVAKIAMGIGLNKGIEEELDGTTQVTREAAAVYAFNTIQADMVEYDSSNSLEINGVKVTMGGGNAVPQTWSTSNTNANNINRRTSDGANARPIVQFAERYFEKLRREPNGWDEYTDSDFGRPAIRWFWKGVEIGTYAEPTSVETYTGNVAVNTIYSDLNMGSSDDAAELYFNGRYAGTFKLSKSNGDDLDTMSAMTKDKIGDGTLVEVYHNDTTNHVIVCVINVWGGKIVSFKDATSTKGERAVLEVGKYDEDNTLGMAISAPKGINDKPEYREYELKDEELDVYEEDNIVAYTYSESDHEIKDILYQLEPLEGTLTRRYEGKKVVLDGDEYKYAKGIVFSLPNDRESDLTNKSEYIAYLDDNGNVLWIEESEFSVDQYALVERIWLENSNSSAVLAHILVDGKPDTTSGPAKDGGAIDGVTNEAVSTSAPRARLILPTGSKKNVTLNESKAYRTDGATPATDTVNANFRAGEIVRYSELSDGTVKLQSVTGGNKVNYAAAIVTTTVPVKNNGAPGTTAVSAAVYKNNLYGFAGITADSATKFVVNDAGTYKVYTGVRNAPDVYGMLTAANAPVAPVGYAYCKGTLAKIVYFTLCNLSNTSKDITFLAAPSVSKLVTEDDSIPHYEYNAVVKNNITTVSVAAYENGQSSGTKLTLGKYAVTVGSDKKGECILLNTTDYNSDDIMTSGSINETNITGERAQGIKRVSGSTEELKLYTIGTPRTEISETLSENVRVFFSDLDGEIEEIDVYDIRTDGNDYVYYTKEDGDVTNIFIQEVDEETAATPTTVGPFYAGQLVAENTSGTVFTWHYIDENDIPSINKVATELAKSPLVGGFPSYNASASSASQFVYNYNGMSITVNLSKDATPRYALTFGAATASVARADKSAVASGNEVYKGETLTVTPAVAGTAPAVTVNDASGKAVTAPVIALTTTDGGATYTFTVPALDRVATKNSDGTIKVAYGSIALS